VITATPAVAAAAAAAVAVADASAVQPTAQPAVNATPIRMLRSRRFPSRLDSQQQQPPPLIARDGPERFVPVAWLADFFVDHRLAFPSLRQAQSPSLRTFCLEAAERVKAQTAEGKGWTALRDVDRFGNLAPFDGPLQDLFALELDAIRSLLAKELLAVPAEIERLMQMLERRARAM
jgi:hypothetical protein